MATLREGERLTSLKRNMNCRICRKPILIDEPCILINPLGGYYNMYRHNNDSCLPKKDTRGARYFKSDEELFRPRAPASHLMPIRKFEDINDEDNTI